MATKGRHIRIEDALWEDAQTAAGNAGETVTDVVRQALEAYVKQARENLPRVMRILETLRQRGDYADVDGETLGRIIRAALRDIPHAEDDDVISYVRGWLRA